MNCIIVSPTATIYEGPISLISFKTLVGAVTILPNHQPTAMILVECKLRYEYIDKNADGLDSFHTKKDVINIKGGVCYIDQKNIQIILQ